jgi:hypothetical protein
MDGNGPFIDGLPIRNGWIFLFFRGVDIPPTRWLLLDVISHLLTGMHMQLVGFHILQPPRGAQPPTSQEPGQSSMTEMARQLMHGRAILSDGTETTHQIASTGRQTWQIRIPYISIFPLGKILANITYRLETFIPSGVGLPEGFARYCLVGGQIVSLLQCHQIDSIPLPSGKLT